MLANLTVAQPFEAALRDRTRLAPQTCRPGSVMALSASGAAWTLDPETDNTELTTHPAGCCMPRWGSPEGRRCWSMSR